MKSRLLCVLHYTPPAHGASKVGDFIKESTKLKNEYECRYIKIKSSDTIEDIGKVNFKKIYLVLELFFKVLWALMVFRPDKIYFTASCQGVAFYRDVLTSMTWKIYRILKPVDIFYHYHTKGVGAFVSGSNRALKLTRFFLNDVYLVLLSRKLKNDFQHVSTYKDVLYLPNGVENTLDDDGFESLIERKYSEEITSINLLYLSNMLKSKGYFKILEMANSTSDPSIHFHFAGSWQNNEDKKEFFDYIQQNGLEDKISFHGFVNGNEKQKLFEKAHIFVFPTRYEKEAFPLSILEAFSYGTPVIATDEASIPDIVDEKTGIILQKNDSLVKALDFAKRKFLNRVSAVCCRERYLENYSLEIFEKNLVNIFRVIPT